VDNRSEVREFLVARRARVTPDQAGLLAYGRNRRVPGLRREEVAMLAGVSIDYYTQIERGMLVGVADAVLDAIAAALRLDEAERVQLFDLARAANTTSRHQVRPALQHLLDAMTEAPAIVCNARLDFIASNRLGRALYSVAFDAPERPVNLARFTFLHPGATEFYSDWEDMAGAAVEILRAGSDHDLSDLVGELCTGSEPFRERWATHDARPHRTGVKRFQHPVVGELSLAQETLALTAEAGLTLTAYTAEPGSPAHDALKLLASWSATVNGYM
jgi:transcriptional regulator with XRE-family HTH domain